MYAYKIYVKYVQNKNMQIIYVQYIQLKVEKSNNNM